MCCAVIAAYSLPSPFTCGLFLGMGGAGPGGLRLSAVPGDRSHYDNNLLMCHVGRLKVGYNLNSLLIHQVGQLKEALDGCMR